MSGQWRIPLAARVRRWRPAPPPLPADRVWAPVAAAITRGLEPLRAGEPRERIAFAAPTRPTTGLATYPGGIVPADIP